MKNLKTIVMLIVIIVLAVTVIYADSYADSNIKVTIDNDMIQFEDAQPTIIEGRTLIPVRKVSESLNATVGWNAETRTVSITKDDKSFALTIDSKIVEIENANDVVLDVPAQIINNRTYVPVRFVSESFGYVVGWDGSTQTVSIVTDSANVVVSGEKEVKSTGIDLSSSGGGMVIVDGPTYYDHYELYESGGVKYVSDHSLTNVNGASYTFSHYRSDEMSFSITDHSQTIQNVFVSDIRKQGLDFAELVIDKYYDVLENGKIYNPGEPGLNYRGTHGEWTVTIKRWKHDNGIFIAIFK